MTGSGAKGTHGGRTRLVPSATSLDSQGATGRRILLGAALGLALWVIRDSVTWVSGALVATIGGAAVFLEVRSWMRTRSLRRRLGETTLSVDPHPARIGDSLDVRLAQPVDPGVLVHAFRLRLVCAAARIETYGIRDREQRVWYTALDTEVATLGDVCHKDGVLTIETLTTIPPDQFPTSEWTHWDMIVEVGVEGCPPLVATFPLEVIRTSPDAAP